MEEKVSAITTSETPAKTITSQPIRAKATRTKDIIAALVLAVASLPDGLASAALVGVNPVYGLYTSMAAPIAGGLLTSTQLMQVATTSAAALAAGEAIASLSGEAR